MIKKFEGELIYPEGGAAGVATCCCLSGGGGGGGVLLDPAKKVKQKLSHKY